MWDMIIIVILFTAVFMRRSQLKFVVGLLVLIIIIRLVAGV